MRRIRRDRTGEGDTAAERARRVQEYATIVANRRRLFEEGEADPLAEMEPRKCRHLADLVEEETPVCSNDAVTINELAASFRVSKRTVHRLVNAGMLPAPDIRLSRKVVRWSRRPLLDWLAARGMSSMGFELYTPEETRDEPVTQ